MSVKARKRVAGNAGSGIGPELVFGLVAPIGAPLGFFVSILESVLEAHGYSVDTIQLSDFLGHQLDLAVPTPPPGSKEFRRLYELMERGNRLREITGSYDVLSLMCAYTIMQGRSKAIPRARYGTAFIVRQLKHPDEIRRLRSIYGRSFYLVGLNCPRPRRREHLSIIRGMKEHEADALITKDEGEESSWGQHLTDAFHLSDVFIDYRGAEDTKRVQKETERFIDLLFGATGISPSKDEYGMYLARSAALRSADLSRQVGAAAMTVDGDILAVGTNEVPRAGGGQYWEGDRDDARDIKLGYDSNARQQRRILVELLERIEPSFKELSARERADRLALRSKQLEGTGIDSLTEFGRVVHAEMAAIVSAARVGISLRGSILYTTTFPCHNCAKHIVAAGIKSVLYIEPYEKSLALSLHKDSIELDGEREHRGEGGRSHVSFRAFSGVSPRRFEDLFSMVTPDGRGLKRKNKSGDLVTKPWGVRADEPPNSYIEREALAASLLNDLISPKAEKNG